MTSGYLQVVGFAAFCLVFGALMSGPSAEQSASRGAAAVLPVLSRATERDQRASAGVARTRAQMEEHDSNSWHVVVSCVVLLYLTMALGFHLVKTKKLSGVVVAVVISSCSFLVTQTNFFREISFQLSIVGVVSMAVHVISHPTHQKGREERGRGRREKFFHHSR